MVLLLERTKKRLNKNSTPSKQDLTLCSAFYTCCRHFQIKTTCICLSSYRGLFVSVAIRIRILQYNQVRASHGGNVLTRGFHSRPGAVPFSTSCLTDGNSSSNFSVNSCDISYLRQRNLMVIASAPSKQNTGITSFLSGRKYRSFLFNSTT